MDALPRLRSSGNLLSGERESRTRKVSRAPRHRSVSIGSSSSQTSEATIRDASTHGCRINSDASWLRLGAIISIRLEDDAGVMGIVRWVRDGAAGVEFLQPLTPGQDAWESLFEDTD